MLRYGRIGMSEGIDTSKSHICNQYHDLLMVVYDLNDFMILNMKGIDYRCYVFNMSKNNAITLLNDSVLDNKGVL